MEDSASTTTEEAKFWRDKHILETKGHKMADGTLEGRSTAIIAAGIDPDNYDKIIEGKTLKPSQEIFSKVKKIFGKYIDTSELNYNLLTIWTLGTYFHDQMETYPLLTLMARKRSGKTRTLKLISSLACGSDGSISTSVTETFLFRHQEGSVFFDEQERISSKEKGALRETINSVYKRGNKIVRYNEKKVDGELKYVEDEFFPFYPMGLANIYGFGDVLEDRSLQVILQRSDKKQTKLIEDYSSNSEIQRLRREFSKLDAEIPSGLFSEWNKYIQDIGKVKDEFKELFEVISRTDLSGRPLEIFFPLFVVAKVFGVLPIIVKYAEEYMAKQEGEFVNNIDDLLHNFIESSGYSGFVNQSKILADFKASLEEQEEWMNSKWFGRALKRLGVIKQKRRVDGRAQVELNPTNTINYTNTTKPTNTTNKVDFVV